MLVTLWIAFFLFLLFLLGSAVGSFLNVCIVRLPEGRSLLRPASCCGHCHKPIRTRDNIPLVSYWLLRGRCHACGTPFSMRYFWIELATGFSFVLIFWLVIVRNILHLEALSLYEDDYLHLLMSVFQPLIWLLFAVHIVPICLLIVAAMTNFERHSVPRCVTVCGVVLGLSASLLFPWPWPDASLNYPHLARRRAAAARMARKEVPTPRAALHPWPMWEPLPDWLPPGSRRLGLASGLAGILAGMVLMALVRVTFNMGVGTPAVGWGEVSLSMIAGGFLGWQPMVVAALLGSVVGLVAAVLQGARKRRQQISFGICMALAIVAVRLGWLRIGPSLHGLFSNAPRLLLFAAICLGSLPVFAVCLRLLRTPTAEQA